MIGQTISHYQIEEELGRGGMGVVYKATDTKLNRTVALKFLPPHVVAAEKDRQRFRREAQAAAGLSHPNIATVFAIEEAEDQAFIAMEFVDGETLADSIDRGPLKVDDAIDIAIQIAGGLQVAHEQQIVHRDIKPSNIMLTSRGHVKIMDFGLAKVSQASMLTQTGSTLGTVGYMSPEQARGEDVDRRTDIWGLGCVLYQMITGQTPFAGEYEQAIVYSILNSEPQPLTALRTGVPIALDGIIAKILAKDPSMRYQHVDELPADLKAVLAGSTMQMSRAMPAYSSASTVPTTQHAAQTATESREVSAVTVRSTGPAWLPWSVAGAGILAAIVLFLMRPGPPDPEPVQRFLLPNVVEESTLRDIPTISDDGSVIVYENVQMDARVYAQHLRDNEVVDLGTTRIITQAKSYMVSPDGQWVGFSDPEIGWVRQSTRGGNRDIIADDQSLEMAFKTESVMLAFDNHRNSGSDSLSLWEITETSATLLHELTQETRSAWAYMPQYVSEHNLLLFAESSGNTEDPVQFHTWSVDLDSGEKTLLARRANRPRYLDNGYVVFIRGNDLHAARFYEDGPRLGPSFPVLGGVRVIGDGWIPRYDVSKNGVLVYREALADVDESQPSVATLEAGKDPEPFAAFTRAARDFRFSPDGRKILVHSLSDDSDIWLLDRILGTSERVTTGPEEDETPQWDPDGEHFYFSGEVGDTEYLLRTSINNPSNVDTLFSAQYHLHVESVSPDGRYVFMAIRKSDQSGFDIWTYNTETGEGALLLDSDYSEQGADLSPDGQWIVYSSTEGGFNQIYLNRFPEMDRRQLLSPGEAYGPIWSQDGQSIFYVDEENDTLKRMPLVNGVAGRAETVDVNTSRLDLGGSGHRGYDVFDNGREFVSGISGNISGNDTQLRVVTGFRTLVEEMDPERE